MAPAAVAAEAADDALVAADEAAAAAAAAPEDPAYLTILSSTGPDCMACALDQALQTAPHST